MFNIYFRVGWGPNSSTTANKANL